MVGLSSRQHESDSSNLVPTTIWQLSQQASGRRDCNMTLACHGSMTQGHGNLVGMQLGILTQRVGAAARELLPPISKPYPSGVVVRGKEIYIFEHRSQHTHTRVLWLTRRVRAGMWVGAERRLAAACVPVTWSAASGGG